MILSVKTSFPFFQIWFECMFWSEVQSQDHVYAPKINQLRKAEHNKNKCSKCFTGRVALVSIAFQMSLWWTNYVFGREVNNCKFFFLPFYFFRFVFILSWMKESFKQKSILVENKCCRYVLNFSNTKNSWSTQKEYKYHFVFHWEMRKFE